MPEYKGDAKIYEHITKADGNYLAFLVKNMWLLVYGNRQSIPKLLAFVSKVDNIGSPIDPAEQEICDTARNIAVFLNLPFISVWFMENNSNVFIRDPEVGISDIISYSQLRDLFERHGVVQPGTPKKAVNQYVSSSYHTWQRDNLGQITVSDLDLIRYKNGRVEEIIELKRSKKSIEYWTPYEDDYANFALLINMIVRSGKKIPFTLYYNVMYDGAAGQRKEDISKIKVFDFTVPSTVIDRSQVKYKYRGIFPLETLIRPTTDRPL